MPGGLMWSLVGILAIQGTELFLEGPKIRCHRLAGLCIGCDARLAATPRIYARRVDCGAGVAGSVLRDRPQKTFSVGIIAPADVLDDARDLLRGAHHADDPVGSPVQPGILPLVEVEAKRRKKLGWNSGTSSTTQANLTHTRMGTSCVIIRLMESIGWPALGTSATDVFLLMKWVLVR